MAKPQHYHNGPDIPKGPRDKAEETRGEEEDTGTGGKGREGKESAAHGTPPSPAEQTADKGTAIRPERERRRRQRRRRQRRRKSMKRREEGIERHPGGARSRSLALGETPPPRGKRGPPGIPPRTCAPVVAGSIWGLPTSQRRVTPGWGNHRRRCMAALLAPPCCSVSELVCQALRSSGAPLHGYFGRGQRRGVSWSSNSVQEPPAIPLPGSP